MQFTINRLSGCDINQTYGPFYPVLNTCCECYKNVHIHTYYPFSSSVWICDSCEYREIYTSDDDEQIILCEKTTTENLFIENKKTYKHRIDLLHIHTFD